VAKHRRAMRWTWPASSWIDRYQVSHSIHCRRGDFLRLARSVCITCFASVANTGVVRRMAPPAYSRLAEPAPANDHSEVLHLQPTLLDPDQHDQLPGTLQRFGPTPPTERLHRDVHHPRRRPHHAGGVDARRRRTPDDALPVQARPARVEVQLVVLPTRRPPPREPPRPLAHPPFLLAPPEHASVRQKSLSP
jgi:hypothetical protein